MEIDTFGERLRQERDERRLTRDEAARRIGCSVAMLRKIEADERRPSAQVAELIGNWLGISPEKRATFIRVARGELGVGRLLPRAEPGGLTVPVTSLAPPGTNMPTSPTPLIGRGRELAHLRECLANPQCRLLTLVGPGGIGKSRLAVELAAQMQPSFEDGVYFVPLAPITSAGFIVPVIADSIGFTFERTDKTDPKTQLLKYSTDRQMLLVLDNVEHLLEGPDGGLFVELLAAAPRLKLLVTSRQTMNLRSEWVFEVGGLPVPTEQHDTLSGKDTSVELFLQRARRAHVGFEPTTSDLPAIVRICRLVEGMPLALELAAAWVRTLTCAEIADEIEHDLDFLRTSARDLPTRHRSMRAVFDHSWELLSENEQSALGQLSVFRGGFGREGADQVAGASLQMLSGLVAKSLIRRTSEGRYDLHELIRQYASGYMEADPARSTVARRQHYAFYLAMAETAAINLKGLGQLEALRRLELEHENLRAALEWALAEGQEDGGSKDAALRLAGALRWFWQMRAYFHEGRSWLSRALGREPEYPPPSTPLAEPPPRVEPADRAGTRAEALEGLALLTNSLGMHHAAFSLAEESAAVFRELGDKQGLAEALLIAGQTLRWHGDPLKGRSRMQDALALFRDVGDRWNVARALFRLGSDLADFGGEANGQTMLEESSAILEKLGDRYIYVSVLNARGLLASGLGAYASARSLLDRSLAVAREIRDPWDTANALTNIGCVLQIQGAYVAAEYHFLEALSLYEEWGHSAWSADPLCALADNATAQGDLAEAAFYLQRAAPHVDASANTWLQVLLGYFRGLLASRQGDMSTARTLLEEDMRLAREYQYQPDLARSLVTLARVLDSLGESPRAASVLCEGLQIYANSANRLGMAQGLEACGSLRLPQDPGEAARLCGVAEGIRFEIGAPLPPGEQFSQDRLLIALHSTLGEDRFTEAWSAGHSASAARVVENVLASLGSSPN